MVDVFELASELTWATCYMCYSMGEQKPGSFREVKIMQDTCGNHPNQVGFPTQPLWKNHRFFRGILALDLGWASSKLHFSTSGGCSGTNPLVSLNKGLCIKPLFFWGGCTVRVGVGWRPQPKTLVLHPSIEPPSFIRATVAISRGPSEKHRWWRSESQHLRGTAWKTIMLVKGYLPPKCPSSRK